MSTKKEEELPALPPDAPEVFASGWSPNTGTVNVGNLELAAFGELLTAHLTPHAAWRFDYGVITALHDTTGTANSGTITVDASRAKLSTSTDTSGIARVSTRKRLRYLPGMGGLVRCTAVFATAKAATQQIIGIGDTSDGFFFGYNGVSFGIMIRRAESDTWVDSTSWNGTAFRDTLNPQLGNIYQIRFQWLGYGVVYWFIYDKSVLSFVPVHRLLYPNTNALTHILNPTLPVMAEIKNIGNNTDMVMYTPSSLACLEGTEKSEFVDPLTVSNSFDLLVSFTDTNKNHMLTIQNKSIFNSLANRIPVEIASIDLSRGNAGSPTTTVQIYRNATTTGALSFVDVDASNSPVATSITATTVTSTNAERSYTMTAASLAGRALTFPGGELTLQPGTSITIAITDSNGTTTDYAVTVNWRELF